MSAIDIGALDIEDSIKAALLQMSSHVIVDGFDTKGANGYSFFGTNTMLDRRIALKFYYWGSDKDTFAEPKRLAELQSEHVLPIFDAAPIDDEWAYFSTPFCDHGDLDKAIVMRRFGNIQAIDAVIQILSGTSYLHSQGFVHRDLKPSNIFVDVNGKHLIGDFGSVRKVTDDWATSSSAHSLIYRPPESFSNKYHKTGDIYQIGMLLYQLLGGRLPYEERAYLSEKEKQIYDAIGNSFERQMYARNIIEKRIMKGKILDQTTLPAWVPSSLKTIIRDACRTDWSMRYQSCAEMLASLTQCRSRVLPWQLIETNPTLLTTPSFRVVCSGELYSIEKRSTANWRKVNLAGKMSVLDEAIKWIEANR